MSNSNDAYDRTAAQQERVAEALRGLELFASDKRPEDDDEYAIRIHRVRKVLEWALTNEVTMKVVVRIFPTALPEFSGIEGGALSCAQTGCQLPPLMPPPPPSSRWTCEMGRFALRCSPSRLAPGAAAAHRPSTDLPALADVGSGDAKERSHSRKGRAQFGI
ncbi:MAG: hypothetical protein F4X20_02500 [Dehalococcoidia bacterium]|nr:hypothetical protein [Dehalococcoidia bacterium]